MKSYVRLAIGIVLAVSFVPASAHPALAAPSATQSSGVKAGFNAQTAALLDSATAVYKRYKSYQHTETLSSEDIAENGVIKKNRDVKFTLALERPNKFRFASISVPVSSREMLFVSDGKSCYNFHGANADFKGDIAQYTKTPVGPLYKNIDLLDELNTRLLGTYLITMMLQGDVYADKDLNLQLKALKIGPSLMEDGKKWIPLRSSSGGFTITFYFDAAAHTLGKVVQTPLIAPSIGTIVETQTYSDVKVDQPIEASVFAFTAPAEAKIVAEFYGADAKEEAENKARNAKYVGKPAPDFIAKDLNGKDVSLSSFKGKVVMIDFWGSIREGPHIMMPRIQDFHERYGQDVAVLAVDTWERKEDCLAFLKANSMYTMPVLLDPAETNRASSIATKLYGVPYLPTTIIIDKEGVIRTYAHGMHRISFYLDALMNLGIQIDGK